MLERGPSSTLPQMPAMPHMLRSPVVFRVPKQKPREPPLCRSALKGTKLAHRLHKVGAQRAYCCAALVRPRHALVSDSVSIRPFISRSPDFPAIGTPPAATGAQAPSIRAAPMADIRSGDPCGGMRSVREESR